MESQKENDNRRLLHTAAWIWISYLVALLAIDLVIYAHRFGPMVVMYHFLNFLPAVIFLIMSYDHESEPQNAVSTNVMILLITELPITVNQFFDLRLPPAPLSNLEGLAIRQLPILIIGLILVAWTFKRSGVILFSLGISLFEILLIFLFKGFNIPRLPAILLIIVVRMVCFLVIGMFINLLLHSLRMKQRDLQHANEQLSHYASTLETLTITRERNRMSRELHDTAVHTLSGLAVQLETASAYMDVEPQTSKQLLNQSLQTVRNGLDETRRALKALRASPLEDLGLLLALQTLLENTAQRGKLTLHSQLPQSLTLAPDIEQTLYRITQESVENVLHHANAQNLTFSLTHENDDLNLIIEDDGIGFDVKKAAPSGHYGLTGMQERAQVIGGTLIVTSQPGKGCKIHFYLPGAAQ